MKAGPSGSAIRSLIPNHRKLLRSKAVVVSVAEKSGQDPGRYGRERRAQANEVRDFGVRSRHRNSKRPGRGQATGSCGVTGTRRRNLWSSFLWLMVHAPAWDRACGHARDGRPCSRDRCGAQHQKMPSLSIGARLRQPVRPWVGRGEPLPSDQEPRTVGLVRLRDDGSNARGRSIGPCGTPLAGRAAGSGA